MKNLKDNKGTTLLVVLVLSAVALVVAAGLIYMVTESTKLSGGGKRYKTALDVGRACANVTIQYIESRPTISSVYAPAHVNFAIVDIDRLVDTSNGKLYATNTDWDGSDQDISIVDDDTDTYDITCGFAGSPFTSYVKITGTRRGNSGLAGNRLHGGGTTDAKWSGGGAGSIPVTSYPWLYAIEVLSINPASAPNKQQRARLSVLYQY
jgi:hypothetical protein